MTIKRILMSLLLPCLLWLSAATTADAAGNGTIEGMVSNGTIGGSSIAGLEVTLKQFQGEDELASLTTTTDDNGLFSFSNLDTGANRQYIVSIIYQEVEYASDYVGFEEGTTTLVIDKQVYDATTDISVVSAPMSHMIVYPGENSALIKEFYLYVNNSDRTYTGPEGGVEAGTLMFSLPPGAVNLEITMGLMDCCLIFTEDGFSETMPLMPGQREVAFSYQVDFNGAKRDIACMMYYPITNFDLLIEGQDFIVNDDQLIESEPLDISGSLFSHYRRTDVPAGQEITFQIKGQNQELQTLNSIWVIITVAAIAFAIIAFYLMRRTSVAVKADDDTETAKDLLISELANLDDDFEQGRIPEDVYQEQRAAKKARLSELIQRSK